MATAWHGCYYINPLWKIKNEIPDRIILTAFKFSIQWTFQNAVVPHNTLLLWMESKQSWWLKRIR